jgi:hypothetical protein
MRVSRLIRSTNWKYAIGEFLLIVAGVTLALTATSWYEDRRERRDERLILQQISAALDADLADLKARFEELTRSEEQLVSLLELLRKDELGPEANSYFGSVALWRGGVFARSGPYEVLKGQGLSLISNGSLRLKLVDLYERGIGELESMTSVDRNIALDQVLPYIWQNFRREGSGYVPLQGYEALDSDMYFQNLAEQKLDRLQDRLLPSYEDTIALTEEVLTDIRDEFGVSLR